MDLKDSLPIFFERANAYDAFWNLDILVTVGIFAFLGSVPHFKHPIELSIILSATFLLFAISNLGGLLWCLQQRRILGDIIIAENGKCGTFPDLTAPCGQRASAISSLISISDPCWVRVPNPYGVILFHTVFDIVTIALIFVIPRQA